MPDRCFRIAVIVVSLGLAGCIKPRGESAGPAPAEGPTTLPVAVLPSAELHPATEDEELRLPPPAKSDVSYGEAVGEKSDLPPFASSMASSAGKRLVLPVAGIEEDSIRDTYGDMRGSQPHRALDIAAPRGSPVVAVDEGRIRKLFRSEKGGLTIYQFDTGSKLCYYYAHLDSYAEGLREGDVVRRGEVIGYVGVSGNAPKHAPHLHFEVTKVGPQGSWHGGEPVNPYPMMID